METPSDDRWRPIEDLPDDHPSLALSEMRSLATVWQEQRSHLAGEDRLKRFNERLARELAIETGILERLYTLDRGVTQLLIERGIDAALIPHDSTDEDPEKVAALISDQHEAAESLFDFVGGGRTLTTSYIKELHALLTRHQSVTVARDSRGNQVEVPLRKGEWKLRPNNPVRRNGTAHEYCPPEQVGSDMDRLVELHADHLEKEVAPEVAAAWLHHRFTQIHPFQDGNGRVARCLASLVLIRAGWFPLVVERDDRKRYLAALEAADKGILAPLVDLVGVLERRSFVRALSVAREVEHRAPVTQVIGAARQDLIERRKAIRKDWEKLRELAAKLRKRGSEVLLDVKRELEETLAGMEPYRFKFHVDSSSAEGERHSWFSRQVIEVAHELRYFANINEYHSWVRLRLGSRIPPAGEDQAEILISFHGVGREYAGVLGASIGFYRRREDDEGNREIVGLRPLSGELFQFNYAEKPAEAMKRFDAWLEESLPEGLDTWRKGL